MNTSRRNFLRISAFTLAGTAITSELLAVDKRRKDVLGIQLYTVRDDMVKDSAGTLKALAEMGYKNVEHANYINRKFYGFSAKDFKKILDDTGLTMVSGHVQFGLEDWNIAEKQFTDHWKYTIEDAVTAGQHFLVTPWMNEDVRTDHNKLMRLLDLFNKSGELCKRSGIRFGYHNHDFEFNTKVNNKTLYDIILAGMDKDLVVQELDIGNMYNGGGSPLEVLKNHPGRFEMMHVKDEIKSKKGEMGDDYESTILGKGILPVHKIVDYAGKYGGTSYFIIEQESYQGISPLQCSKEDYRIMKNWGF